MSLKICRFQLFGIAETYQIRASQGTSENSIRTVHCSLQANPRTYGAVFNRAKAYEMIRRNHDNKNVIS